MLIPYTTLSPTALKAIVEEFVTRDGTDHSDIQRRVETVLQQLSAGHLNIHYDHATQTCNILPQAEKPPDTSRPG